MILLNQMYFHVKCEFFRIISHNGRNNSRLSNHFGNKIVFSRIGLSLYLAVFFSSVCIINLSWFFHYHVYNRSDGSIHSIDLFDYVYWWYFFFHNKFNKNVVDFIVGQKTLLICRKFDWNSLLSTRKCEYISPMRSITLQNVLNI